MLLTATRKSPPGTAPPAAIRVPAFSEDWRILRALALYRFLLLFVLLGMQESGYVPDFFSHIDLQLFHQGCIGYALAAFVLLAAVYRRWPGMQIQPHLHFTIDALGTATLVYACDGVGSGMAVLLITPMVGTGLILPTRAALSNAAAGTLLMFGEEWVREFINVGNSANWTATTILGLIFFGSTAAGNTMARRARRSEALAARVGSDLASLSQLNSRIIETMETGVLVVEASKRIRLGNSAARHLLGTGIVLDDRPLDQACPALAAALEAWSSKHLADDNSTIITGNGTKIVPRFMPLGTQPDAPSLILLDTANRLFEQAQQMKLTALGRLSASIAHEIRNPLSAINHASQLLAESKQLDEADHRLLDMIQRHGVRLDAIVTDVLSLSRREQIVPTQISLQPWLQRAIVQYQEAHSDSQRSIKLGAMEDRLSIRFDPRHLQQVLHNLWDNSFLHGGEVKEAIHVTLCGHRLPNSHLPCLEIRDDGPGIPGEIIDQVFEPFFTTARAGSGLGLYLARELCEYNHAKLQYEALTNGACFRIIFTAA